MALTAIRGRAHSRARPLVSEAQAALDDASTRAKTYQEEAEGYIRQNPLQSIGIAVGDHVLAQFTTSAAP
jgi:ElaB/YqjD/DUF883 family membrane-anchored ribosome-binding protein